MRLTLYQGIIEVVTKNPELCAGAGVYSYVSSLFEEEGASHRWWLDKLGREGEEGWVLEEPVGAY